MSDEPPQGAPASHRLVADRHTSIPLVGWVTIGLTTLLVVTLIALRLVHAPYVIIRPGPAYDALGTLSDGRPLIEVNGRDRYAAEGELRFTTVSLSGGPSYPVSWLDWLEAKFDPHARIEPESTYFRPEDTAEDVRDYVVALMDASQNAAAVVALRAAGTPVEQRAVVGEVGEWTPAFGTLKAGDVVTAVNGTQVNDATAVITQLRRVTPGTNVTLQIERDGTPQEVTTRFAAAGEKPGVYFADSYASPVTLTFHAGDVGGSSAGLMFALAAYDVLTPGSLTGGKRIAGTGALGLDGMVGAISGSPFKAYGAERDGSEFFLLPQENCAEIAGADVGDIRVVPVESFDEAVAVVEEIASGGADLPTCPVS